MMFDTFIQDIDQLISELETFQKQQSTFSAEDKAQQLENEAEGWAALSDASKIPWATEKEIPVIDFEPYFNARTDKERTKARKCIAKELERASRASGFYLLRGHNVMSEDLQGCYDAGKNYFKLPKKVKLQHEFDSSKVPKGCGYLPIGERKLPKRTKGNLVEAYIFKQLMTSDGSHNLELDRNAWPNLPEHTFRNPVEKYMKRIESLALSMLPIYAEALKLDPSYFTKYFHKPMFRFRISCYPPTATYEPEQYGIAPHVDTSFFTILAQQKPGLVVFVEETKRWVRVPAPHDCFVINTGQLLKQITNDEWCAARHYALNRSDSSKSTRFSLPFFFNATPDAKLSVVPSLVGKGAKYPPLSYLDGQGVVQGE